VAKIGDLFGYRLGSGISPRPPFAWPSPKNVWFFTAANTLWGELAWQLGKADGFALVQGADANGTSPGKDVLCSLLSRFAPCVVLLDEPVVYIRQFVDSQQLSGGTYDSNLSFIQSLTEAAKLLLQVPPFSKAPAPG
jgi:predicted AAA+ superfamily ATPase